MLNSERREHKGAQAEGDEVSRVGSLHRKLAMSTVPLVVAILLVIPQNPLAAATRRPLVLDATGLSSLHLATNQSVAYQQMVRLLGKPTTPLTATPSLGLCGVGAMASWHAYSLYFNHHRLVGLSLGPGKVPAGETSRGLHLGDTLKRARSLYGTSLKTSNNGGGAWFVTTNKGRLDGFLSPSTSVAPRPQSRILTIDVGVVGCPAMSP